MPVHRLVSAAGTTNSTNIKASGGRIKRMFVTNTSASTKYLKLYNKASAPTIGTDAPIYTIGLPATDTSFVEFSTPIDFTAGIGYGLTGAAADNDTTALTAADITALNIDYT